MKEKKTKKKSKGKTQKPERFNYWEGWRLYDPRKGETLFDFTVHAKGKIEKTENIIPRGKLPDYWRSWNLPELINADIHVLLNPEVVAFIDDLRKKYAYDKKARGAAKFRLEDYSGAIQDYTKAIELDPKQVGLYVGRGLAKIRIGQKDSGCLDMSKARELGIQNADEVMREWCK